MILLDIGFGLLVTAAVGLLGHYEPSLQLVLVGVAASVLPDWDMILYLMLKGKLDKWAHKHCDISHYPLLVIPIASMATGYWLGFEYGVVVSLATFIHYLNDSLAVGWGIRWLFPIDWRYFAYRSIGDKPPRLHAWHRREQDAIAKLYGDSHWVKRKKQWWLDATILAGGVLAIVAWMYIP